MNMTVVVFLLLAYLAGSLPSGHLAGRVRGVDLRKRGSGNTGATNVYRVLGARAALPVLLVDIAKGYVPAAMFPGWDGGGVNELGVLYGVAAIAGHVWPVTLRFRGGKGVATGAGVLLALVPLATFVAALIWIGIVSLTRYVSVGSLLTAAVVPLLAVLFDAPGATVLFCGLVALFVWWTHRENIRRLIAGTEHRFGAGSRRAARERTAASEPTDDGASGEDE